jgi:hypothetical protein
MQHAIVLYVLHNVKLVAMEVFVYYVQLDIFGKINHRLVFVYQYVHHSDQFYHLMVVNLVKIKIVQLATLIINVINAKTYLYCSKDSALINAHQNISTTNL